MYKTLLVLLLVLVVIPLSSCYSARDLMMDMGYTDAHDLVPLDSFATPESSSGEGILIAIAAPDGGVCILECNLNRVVIYYEEVTPYVVVVIDPEDTGSTGEGTAQTLTLARRIQLFALRYEIHLPKGSESQYIILR